MKQVKEFIELNSYSWADTVKAVIDADQKVKQYTDKGYSKVTAYIDTNSDEIIIEYIRPFTKEEQEAAIKKRIAAMERASKRRQALKRQIERLESEILEAERETERMNNELKVFTNKT